LIPEIDIFGLSIKTFGLMFGLAFIASGSLVARRLKELGKLPDLAYELTFAALFGGFLGARLWYIAEHWGDKGFFDTIFSGSGLTWYGGALGGAAAVLVWARRRDMFSVDLLDICAPALALGYAVGRIGCELSGDGDYGEPSDLPWAHAYPDGVVPTEDKVHPTPVYETLTMGAVAWWLWRRRDREPPGRLFALYLVAAGVERFLVEFVRRNEAVFIGLSVAQFVSLVMIAAGAAWLIRGFPKRAPLTV
jgi:phosphatidylglycerol:prolipoprotein diacylglycerol transferase